MRQLWIGVLLAWVMVTGALGSPVKSPKRLVDGHMVDLAPLCRWWTNQGGARPLSGWVRVTGTIVGTNSWGWVVEGTAQHGARRQEEGGGKDRGESSKILLLDPPVQDLVEFQQASAQLRVLVEERNQIAQREASAKSREKAISKELKAEPRPRVRSRALAQERRELAAMESQATAQLKNLDDQIRVLKNKLAVYPNSDHYVLDCFALDTGREANGLPTYDHGSVLQY